MRKLDTLAASKRWGIVPDQSAAACYVYWIGNAHIFPWFRDYNDFEQSEVSLVKIGIASDPYKRLRDLQVGSMVSLSIWAVERFESAAAALSMEAELHDRYSAFRSHGEWFHIKGAVREHLRGLMGPPIEDFSLLED